MSERDEFEAWARRMGYGDELGEVKELDTFAMQYAWQGFQAARAPQAVPALTDAQIDQIARANNLDGSMLDGPRHEYWRAFARALLAAAPQPSPEALTECAEIDPEAWKSLKAHAHDWRFSLQDHLYKCDCGATRGDYPFGAASFKD